MPSDSAAYCNTPCTDELDRYCGGSTYMSVYELGEETCPLKGKDHVYILIKMGMMAERTVCVLCYLLYVRD